MVPRTSKSASRARPRSPPISQKIPPSTSTAASGLTNITQRQPGANQYARAAGEAADERRGTDHQRSGDQHAPATQQVGGPAAQQHEAAVGEQVAAGDPLQALLGEAQVAANRGKRDVDDRG